MIKNREHNIIAGLDIGTSKVVAIVGQVQPDSGLEIIGMGQPSLIFFQINRFEKLICGRTPCSELLSF